MSEQEVLEGKQLPAALLEPQRAGAKAADRTRSHLQHEHTCVVHAALGVNRSVKQAERERGRVDGGTDRGELARRSPRRRDVNRFLEEGTVERLRLVEDSQNFQRSA